MTVNTSDNRYGVAQLIVAPTISEGANYTTISSALTDAVSGQTIFIRPGVYTENLTLKEGVNLCAFPCDAYGPNVSIVGKMSASFSGLCTLSGLQFETNGDFILEVTGANATEVDMVGCVLLCGDNTGLSNTGSNSLSKINFFECLINLNDTGIAIFSCTNGDLTFRSCTLNNAGLSTTANAFSGMNLRIINTLIGNPVSTSGTTAFLDCFSSHFQCASINSTAIVSNSTANPSAMLLNTTLRSGTATPLTIGAGSIVRTSNFTLEHSNATAISGAGTLVYTDVNQLSTVGAVSPTTTTGKGQVGILSGTAPAAGYIGEHIRGFLDSGSAINLTTLTPANVTSISLGKGIWDITFLAVFGGGAITGTQTLACINTTSASTAGTTPGDNLLSSPQVPTAGSNSYINVPVFRQNVASTTTYFGVVRATFTVGTATAFGRLSAVRVA